jgi:hypothetical protein
MFFRTWNNGDYYINEVKKVPAEVVNAVPDAVAPVYWDYYSTTEEKFDTMIKMHKQFKGETWFAGGAWCWVGFAPLNQFSINNMSLALSACRKNKVKNIFMTMWGDDGMECSHFSQLPSLMYIAECAKGNTDEEKIKAKFKRIVGVDYDDFMKVDLPNYVTDTPAADYSCPSKTMLYSDPFLGFLDSTVKTGAAKKYAELSEQLKAVSKKSRRFGYLFDTAEKLSNVLLYKYEMGTKTRAAYKAGDKEELLRLAKEDYTLAISSLKVFIKTFEKQWMKENKPQGFEVQHARLGGLLYRLDYCKRTLLDYASGKTASIPELCEDILKFKTEGESIYYNGYSRTITSNVL